MRRVVHQVGARRSHHKALDAIKPPRRTSWPEDLAKAAEAEVEKLTGIYNKKVEA